MMTGLNLSLVSHYINCDTCQNQEHCDIARMLITSISSSEGLCNTTYNSQLELNDRISSSAPDLSTRDRSTSEIANVRNSLQTMIENQSTMYNPSVENETEKSNGQSSRFDNE